MTKSASSTGSNGQIASFSSAQSRDRDANLFAHFARDTPGSVVRRVSVDSLLPSFAVSNRDYRPSFRSFPILPSTDEDINNPRLSQMRVTQVLLTTSVALVACSNGFVSTTETGTKVEATVDTTSTSADNDAAEMFVHKVPFKYGNVTGTMVVTIDKSSLHETSDDSASTDPSSVYDFQQLEKSDSGSGEEERGLFGFVATHFVQYKLTEKAISWVKSVI